MRRAAPWLLFVWLVLAAALFAQVEIQIEGAHGWASALPTWRISDARFLKAFFGGREITGYHVFTFSFMFVAFHFPMVLFNRFSLRTEARIIGCLMLFWVVEDVLWFAMNPAYGIRKFVPENIPWHPHWWLGVPVDYLVFVSVASALFWWSSRRPVLGSAVPVANTPRRPV